MFSPVKLSVCHGRGCDYFSRTEVQPKHALTPSSSYLQPWSGNSSRFAAYTKLYFSRSASHVLAMVTNTLLPDTSKLLSRRPGQKTFHALYQVCKDLCCTSKSVRKLAADPHRCRRYSTFIAMCSPWLTCRRGKKVKVIASHFPRGCASRCFMVRLIPCFLRNFAMCHQPVRVCAMMKIERKLKRFPNFSLLHSNDLTTIATDFTSE